MAKEYKQVQMNMKEETIEQIEKLAKTLNASNRTDAVKRSVDIAEFIANAIQEGGKVIISNKNGKKREIVIPGLST